MTRHLSETRGDTTADCDESDSVFLKINSEFHISDIVREDKPAYLIHLQDKQIYEQTLSIPYPYTEADADWWIHHNLDLGEMSPSWAIRESQTGWLIGGIGFPGHEFDGNHCAEIGYWLAKPYWNKGIMTESVRQITHYAFSSLNLVRITAHVFAFNAGSQRVLEKCGYRCEGTLRQHYKKDGKIFDGKIFAILRGELPA